jgi:uncharacterized membrane protein
MDGLKRLGSSKLPAVIAMIAGIPEDLPNKRAAIGAEAATKHVAAIGATVVIFDVAGDLQGIRRHGQHRHVRPAGRLLAIAAMTIAREHRFYRAFIAHGAALATAAKSTHGFAPSLSLQRFRQALSIPNTRANFASSEFPRPLAGEG